MGCSGHRCTILYESPDKSFLGLKGVRSDSERQVQEQVRVLRRSDRGVLHDGSAARSSKPVAAVWDLAEVIPGPFRRAYPVMSWYQG